MKSKALALTLISVLVLSDFALTQLVNLARAQSSAKITIGANGTVEGTTKIQKTGNLYTFLDNIDGSIIVERDSIIIDGAGFTLSANGGYGVELDYRNHVTVRNLVVANTYRAIDLTYADDNTIVENTIVNSERAIYVWFSSRNNITGNTISNAGNAFDFFDSPNRWSQKNVIAKNTVLDCSTGINLRESNNTFLDNAINASSLGVSIDGHHNLFRNNTITCDWVGFKDSAFDNDIDQSNLLNGKPIIYWIGHRDQTVPSNAAYVLLSKCENIRVQNLNLSEVNLFSTTNSLIAGNVLSDGLFGIKMVESSNNEIIGNHLLHNTRGLDLTNCHDNKIVGNNISFNLDTGVLLFCSHYNTIKQNIVSNNGGEGGIKLLHSSNTFVTENNVTGNSQWGIRVLGDQHDNIVYHNNFIGNKASELQVSMMAPANPSIWDNGTSGNYWSDYSARYKNASEIGNTGIGDTPFYINPNNTDRYPLMKPFTNPRVPDDGTSPKPPTCEPSKAEPLPISLMAACVITIVAVVLVVTLAYRKKHQPTGITGVKKMHLSTIILFMSTKTES